MNKLEKISFSFLPKRFSCIFVLNLSVSRLFIIFSLNFKNAHNRKGIQNQSRIPLDFKNMRGCVYSKAFRMRIRAAHLVLSNYELRLHFVSTFHERTIALLAICCVFDLRFRRNKTSRGMPS